MANPKRKMSKSKVRMRKRSHKVELPTVTNCAQCGAPQQPHRVCPSCGGYRGRQVVAVKAD